MSQAEQMKALGKSVLARQLTQELERTEFGPGFRIEQVRGLVEYVIQQYSEGHGDRIDKLAQVPLAFQVQDVLRDRNMTDEEKVIHLKNLIGHFIVEPPRL